MWIAKIGTAFLGRFGDEIADAHGTPPPLAAPKTLALEVPPYVPSGRRLQFKLPTNSGGKVSVVTLGYFDNDAQRAQIVQEYKTFLRDPNADGAVDCAKRYAEFRRAAGEAPVQPKWSGKPAPFDFGADALRVRAKMPKTHVNFHLG